MKALLVQISLLTGGGMAIASLVINLARRMELFTAVFRAAAVFLAGVIIAFLFLRFFALLLVRFVAQQVLEQQHEHAKEPAKPANRVGRAVPGGERR